MALYTRKNSFSLPLLLFLVLIAALSGCEQAEQSKSIDLSKRTATSNTAHNTSTEYGDDDSGQYKRLLFGFDLRSSPQEDARQYLPFLNYLNEATGYRFELVLTSKDDRLDEKLGTGQVHFAAIGAVSYIKSQQRYGVVPVARGLNANNKAEYQSTMVVKPGSDILSIDDLRGKRLAFGSRDSTQGHLIPRIDLIEHGINLDELAAYIYTDSHRSCADAVLAGRVDVCAMQDTMAKSLQQRELVRIIYTSNYYPSSGIFANSEVNQYVLSKVSDALLAFKPKGQQASTLYNWDKTEMPNGFIAASDGDYRVLRDWLIRLGFLKVTDETD